MKTITLTVQDGRWVSEEPATEPEGTRREYSETEAFQTEDLPTPAPDVVGWLTEETWPTTEEGIKKLVAAMEAMEPYERSVEEKERWERIRAEDKKWELEHEAEYHEQLVKIWQ